MVVNKNGMRPRAAWLADAGYGLALTWTASSMPRGATNPIPYCRAVEQFDVSRLVDQCAEAGAGWLIFAVSHGRQHFPFPSETLDRVLSGRTCDRDLMGEVADALLPLGIPLLFYYPNVGDDSDPDWQRASGWLYDAKSFAALQYDLATEIGERYGERLAGWWLDNCYDPKTQPHRYQCFNANVNTGGYAGIYNFERYASALRTGNADRLVAYNFSGTNSWRSVLGKGIVDYAAGESNEIDRVPSGANSGEGESQWHSLVWMDDFWVHGSRDTVSAPRYGDEHVISYINYVMRHRGAFSYHAAPYQDELVAETTLNQLREIKRAVRDLSRTP